MNIEDFGPFYLFVAAGLIGGVVLFVRGLQAYRHDRLISSVATSTLDGLAAGEVRVTGVVEPIEQTLISPLQSKACVWYRARVETTGDNSRVLMNEEKAQEFRLRGSNGEIRVVPRGARWEIGTVFDERTSFTGAEPVGLDRRSGTAYKSWTEQEPTAMTDAELEAAKEALLTVQTAPLAADDWDKGGNSLFGSTTSEGRRYREARLEPGESITILGQAWPWGDVRKVVLAWNPGANVDRDIAGDIAYAREMGTLAASPEEAWGNAAIPGFGIGLPTAEPEIDPEANELEIPDDPAAHEEALAKYDIPDEELVLSRGLKGGMAVYAGTPTEATQHHDMSFVLGVVGAVMTALCAFALGAMLTGTL